MYGLFFPVRGGRGANGVGGYTKISMPESGTEKVVIAKRGGFTGGLSTIYVSKSLKSLEDVWILLSFPL